MSASLAETIERLLATDPGDRFVSASDVERELVACLAEVKIDPADADWSLVRFVADPDGYEARLDVHLRQVLLAEGRRRLDAGDHLGALRLCNRLLSMDEHNADVLELIQSLHGGERAGTTTRTRWLAAGGLAVLALTGLALVFAGGREPGDTGPTETVPMTGPALSIAEGPDPPPPVPLVIVSPTERAAPTPVRMERSPSDFSEPALRPRALSNLTGEAALASVRINAGDAFVVVFKDGDRIGTSREDLKLAPGVHDLVLKSELYDEKGLTITVDAGERRVETVEMTPKPAVLLFPDAVPEDCTVAIAGEVHTVGAIDRRWTLDRPDQYKSALEVTLTCGDAIPQEMPWNPGVDVVQEFRYSPEP